MNKIKILFVLLGMCMIIPNMSAQSNDTIQMKEGLLIDGGDFLKKWEFKTQNETQIIKDENGYEYKKISDKPFAYIAIANYILNALFSDYVSKDFRINENYLIINNENYKLHLNPSYTPKDISVFLQNKTPYFIRFSEEKLQLVKGKQNED